MADNPRKQTLVDPYPTGTPIQTPDAQGETGPLPGVTPSGTIVDSRAHGMALSAPIADNLTRYELLEEIARGGMGAVLRAWDRSIKREVAIKVMLEKQSDTSAASRRFFAEAEITGQLQHPGIPPVHDLGTLPDGRPFMAMKLIRGRTFNDLLKERSEASADQSRHLQIFEAICQTVAYAHAQGVIHRDLKPHNVMVGAFAEVQVMDWGLAKQIRQSTPYAPREEVPHAEREEYNRDETQAGAIMGTPSYMAPEQARGQIDRLGPRADVFALGSILCQILTGQPAFRGDAVSCIKQAMDGDVADAIRRLDGCGADVELIGLAKICLSPAIEDRYRDGGELAASIAAFRHSVEQRLKHAEMERARAETQAKEQRKRRKVQLALAASVLVLLIGGGIAGWWYDHQASLRRERLARDTQALETALEQTEEALRNDDAAKAEIPFQQAEKRMAEGGAELSRGRFERCKKDLAMLKELDRIDDFRWTAVENKLPDAKERATRWGAAFEAFGIVPGTIAPDDAASRISESLIRERLLSALDTWLLNEPPTDVAAILTTADPNSYRESMRRAIQADNVEQQRVLAARTEAAEQPTRFALVLGRLPALGLAERERSLIAALRRSPGNFAVLMDLGALYPNNNAAFAAERAGWFRAALAVRPANVTAHINLGFAMRDKKDLDGAIAESREAIRLDPKFALAHNNLGNALRDKKDLDGAIAEYKEAIQLDPKFALAHNNLGIALFDKKDLDGAISEYKEAIRLDPKFALAHNNLGIALFDKKDLDGAIAEYKEAIRLDSKSALAHNNLGNALIDKKDLDGAIAEYKEGIRLDPKVAQAHYNLGIALSAKKDLDGAIVAYKEGIRLDPKFALAHNNLGIALYDKKNLEGAIAEYKEAIRLDPKNAGAHNNFGNVLFAKKDLDGAIAEYKEAIRLDPKDAEPHSNLGAALLEKMDLDGAIAESREAIRLDPKSALAHNNLGNALIDKNDLDGAIAEFREAIRLDPKYAEAHYNLGNALSDKKDLDGAIAEYKEAIRLAPKDAPAHNNLGLALLAKKDLDGAIAEYKEAIRLDPKVAQAHYNLGIALSAKKDLDGAIVAYKEAIRLDPRDAEAHYSLGNVLFAKKDLDGAIAEYKEAIRLDPKSALAHNNLGNALRDAGKLAESLDAFREGHRLGSANAGWRYPSEQWVRQAEQWIELDRRVVAILDCKAKPANDAERLALALFCRQPFKELYGASRRFYVEAFAGDPKLADNMRQGYRNDAACATVLAADGKGIDPPPISERPELCRQARAWLAADLKAWSKIFDDAPARNSATVHAKMQHWLADTDLISIRDLEKLKALHPDEQRALEKLWRDVRALRDRTAPPELLPTPKIK